MNRKSDTLAILGAGGHGTVIADAAEISGNWKSIEFFDDADVVDKFTTSREFHWPLVGNSLSLLMNAGLYGGIVVGVGNNSSRLELIEKIVQAGGLVTSIIHPAAVVSRYCNIGIGTVLFAGVVVNVGADIGDGVIVNTGASIDHDTILDDGVHISPHVAVAGGVTIGTRTWIGIGAAVRDGLKIGEDVMVGAGATVVSDLESQVSVIGTPAKPLL